MKGKKHVNEEGKETKIKNKRKRNKKRKENVRKRGKREEIMKRKKGRKEKKSVIFKKRVIY